ncbi:hypothetical protein J2T11_000160 [Paenarthrobacter nicotinovorans]|uniref:hypothetical protein n=1 Tax=Paenarthrobacter nicotinovorans TaxID=29320 RepID=UPI0027816418|nr:hypothetical protein [Paenarthrobacter nicotinovorans]MDP9933836.1 hypothetical protein [Paenarthrobacter nicotinovorans]
MRQRIPALCLLLPVLLTGCAVGNATAQPPTTVTQTATVTAAATPSPTPTMVATSGDYGADLAAAGIIPDSVTRYGQFMKEELCFAPLTKAPFRDYSKFSESVRTLASSETKKTESLRLSVAYFCPERRDLAEEALALHGYK